MALKRSARRIFDLMQAHRAGDLITEADFLTKVGLSKVSLKTYFSKNMLAGFLRRPAGTNDLIEFVRDGKSLVEDEFEAGFSQVARPAFSPTLGLQLVAETGEQYELERKVGNGAVGQVWRAIQSPNDAVAIKFLLPSSDFIEPGHLDSITERFKREARFGRSLSSPYIISYITQGESSGVPFIVMELAESCLRLTATHTELLESEISNIIHCCLLGLSDLHKNKHVHRDIKPGNILKLFNGDYALGDLGIVKWGDLSNEFTHAGTLTRDDIRLGSIRYMAPEQQSAAHDVTPASDIYSLGVVWYELLTGRALTQAEAARQAFPPASENAAISGLVSNMLEYLPGDRPSADQALSVFEKRNLLNAV